MNNKKSVKKVMVYSALLVAIITVLGLVVSYGWAVNVLSVEEKVGVETLGDIRLIYKDCDSSSEASCADLTQDLAPGESVSKVFEVTNESDRELSFSFYFKSLMNTFINEELVYTLENVTTGEVIVEEKALPEAATETENILMTYEVSIGAKTTNQYRMTVKFLNTDYDQNENLEAEYLIRTTIGEAVKKELTASEKTLAALKLSTKKGQPLFANAATTDETADGLYAMKDNYGTSYYFRGAVENNYVKFGGFYWRIIRINGDGSVRMIYDGTSAHANGTYSENRLALPSVAWNTTNYNDAKYVGYMYGGANGSASTNKEQAQTNETNSNIKTQLENWYKTNIRDKGLDGYVADSIFCNDRSTPGKEATGWNDDTGLGYGRNETYYGIYARFSSSGPKYINPKPTFVCLNKNDAFTKEDIEKGNGALGEKVGLITADEVVAAGSGKYETANLIYYLYKGTWYWSLSPCYFRGDAAVFFVGINGGASVNGNTIGVAPVINLSAEYASTLRGEGTQTSPYEIG